MMFLRILGTIWTLPLTLVGLVNALFGGIQQVEFKNWAIYFWVKRIPLGFGYGPVGQTVGQVICLTSNKGHVAVHERRHVSQFLLFGPLMALLYPLASLWALIRCRRLYLDNAFELDAQRYTWNWWNTAPRSEETPF